MLSVTLCWCLTVKLSDLNRNNSQKNNRKLGKIIKLFEKTITGAGIILVLLYALSVHALAIGFDAEDAYASVVVVYSGHAVGSGFAIGENCVITSAHVIDNPNDLGIVNYGGDQYSASIIIIDSVLDIAVLGVEDAVLPVLPTSDYNDLHIGAEIYTIGAPNNLYYTLTKGVLSAKGRTIGDNSFIQFDAAINSGNSGGPLLNNDGEVIGVNTIKITNAEGIGFAIPMTAVNELIIESGIELNDKGNVEGRIAVQANSAEFALRLDESADYTSDYINANTLLIVLLFISGLLNIVLAVMLAYSKQRSVILRTNPSDRTDFDIDILE